MPKVTVGVVLFGTKYLKESLPSLINQDYDNIEFIFRDQQEDKWEAYDFIKNELPEVFEKATVLKGSNNWHSGGHNFIINQMQGDIYICASNDMLYPSNLVSTFVDRLKKNPDFSVATCKSMVWGQENIIDSFGLKVTKWHHFADIGQGQTDNGQYDNQHQVWGSSGALFAITKQALQSIQYKNEYFDELIHYKNDIDLAYRLNWAGQKCLFIPDLKVYHDRQAASYKSKSKSMRESSLLGDLTVLYKNFQGNYNLTTTILTKIYHLLKQTYLVVRYPYLFKVFKKYRKLKPQILEKKLCMNKSNSHPNQSNFKISIIILDFLKSKRVCENVEHIQKQKHNYELEIIIADNSCNAENKAKLETLKKFENVKLIFNETNLGYTKAHNVAAKHASGKYIFIVNPDIIIRNEDTINKMVAYMEQNPDVAILGPKQMNDDGTLAMTVRAFPHLSLQVARRTWVRHIPGIKKLVQHDEMQHLDYDKTQEVDWLQSSFVCVRKNFWDQVNGLCEDYFLFMSDPEICWQAWELGKKVVYYPEVTVYADGIRLSRGGFKAFFKKWTLRQHLKDAIKYQQKHFLKRNPRKN